MDYRHFFEYEVGIQKIKYRGSQGIGCCPVHDDTNPSFSFNIETGQCKCFGCGWKGNAYLLAVELNMDNPRRLIDSSTIDSKNYISPPYEPINTLKSQNKEVHQVDKTTRYNELKERYGNRVELGHEYKDNYVGKDDNGKSVFFYPKGIKIHKEFWVDDCSIDKSCQIFMIEELSNFDKAKPLYIYEGEKDALASPLQGISFSAGAGSIPKDISPLYDFDLVIAYDNDESGEVGSNKLAYQIKTKSPDTNVSIIQWDESLPSGYDVYDDFGKTALEEFDKAIANAKEYQLEEKQVQGYSLMDANKLMNTYTTPPKPIIQNLVVEKGVTVVSGTDGVGKTWFGLEMAISIASGRKFLEFDVRKKPVLVIQFELSNDQLSTRLSKYDLSGAEGNIQFAVLKDDDMIFTDAWAKIGQTITEMNLTDGVVLVDNIYTSTDKDVSKNHELKPLLKMVEHLKNTTGNSFILIAHHNKHDGDKEPILQKCIITGGKTLTNYVSNVFQIGTSSLGADLRRGKITKTRDGFTELYNEPLLLSLNPDTCYWEYRGVIPNEDLHCTQITKKWEYKVLIEFDARQNDVIDFNRNTIRLYMEGEYPDLAPNTINQKITRWLNKMVEFGLIKDRGHDKYQLNRDAIKNLNLDED
jgi:hypothetical protein